jgi:hemoglobin-like flavoprotein
MSPERQALVRQSWKQFEPAIRNAGTRFYERLFELDPEAQRLFAGTNMAEQEEKLMAMFAEIVRVLDQEDVLVTEVAALAHRHVDYGVKDADYESVGAALMWTLEEGLGDAFTPEVKSAWTEAYLLVASVMRRAAAKHGVKHG